MKYWQVVKELEENPSKVFEAWIDGREGWKVRMRVERGVSRYFYFEVFNGESVVDQSLGGGAFNGNLSMGLDWYEVRQSVTWQEAIQAWADGKKVSYSYMGYDKRFVFEDSNTMMSIEKVKNAEWYVED